MAWCLDGCSVLFPFLDVPARRLGLWRFPTGWMVSGIDFELWMCGS
jgi:hypothetical protein